MPCGIEPDDCKLRLKVQSPPEYIEKLIMVKMVTNINEVEKLVGPFTEGSELVDEFTYKWDSRVRWVEWYVRTPWGEYEEIPLVACYCDEVRGMISRCRSGKLVKEWEIGEVDDG